MTTFRKLRPKGIKLICPTNRQNAGYRPDIPTRVFKLYNVALVRVITKDHVLGHWTYVDQATFAFANTQDELSNFQNARYVGSTDAAWLILDLPIHVRFPAVMAVSAPYISTDRISP